MDKRIKMNKYERVTLKAMLRINSKKETPEIAWENASSEVFGIGTSSQKKSCPKNSFLGLCDAGKVKGIEKGCCCIKTKSKNMDYVITAINLINKDRSLLKDKMNLWREITNIKYNQQLDVLFALIDKDYIRL